MEKEDIIRILRQFKKLKGSNYDIVRIGLFGSVARDMINDQSDI
ncbi:MAG: nucleotidyltransferase, partial [Deltaproteobacteria bacterium]|nr:nucleotidyltransferase [Deltaproteobacteria bacterium]